ncbi:MAG: HAD family phosphatase [Prevotella sp.]|nr:HAD family phosphatase [Prevotella sp.]
MTKVKNIVFDLGGVIMTLDHPKAVRRFKELGIKDAEQRLHPYTQTGIFGDLEAGKITDEEFRKGLSELAGREISYQECCYAWQGYVREVPQRNLDALVRLHNEGYRIILLSNTNPFMMEFILSDRFDGKGHSLAHYVDAMYLSYRLKVMKPDETFFRRVLMSEQIIPADTLFVDDGPRNVAAASQIGIRTYCPENGADWTEEIYKYLEY